MNLAKISIYFNPADPKQMKALTAFLKTTTVNELQGVLTVTADEVEEEQEQEQEQEQPKPAAKTAPTKTAPAKAAPKEEAKESSVSLDALRELLTEKVKIGDNRTAIKDALQERGAANLSSLGKEHYDDVYAILQDLKGA